MKILSILLYVTTVIAGINCATSPTGRKQLIIFPDSQMNKMGLDAFTEMRQKQPIERDPRINEYVRCVALAVAAHAQDRTGVSHWDIVVFKDKTANAFALPGGKIGVHTGLLAVAKTAGQLAAVLGHEVGHVIARHGNERVSQGVLAQAGLAAADVSLKNNKSRNLILAGLGVGTQLGVLKYGRKHESEADEIGQELMAKAGFDPQESIDLWKNMAKAGGGGGPEFLSTHPSHETRIDDLKDLLPKTKPLYQQAQSQGRTANCASL